MAGEHPGRAAGTARVTRRGLDRWRRGHPWIYRVDVVERPRTRAGVVRVEDERGAQAGVALWSPASKISLRMLSGGDRRIDGAFWAERLDAALAYRARWAPPGSGAAVSTTACRVVHGESDGLPSLVVDRYGDYLVVQLLSAGLEAVRAEMVEVLRDRLSPAGILARNDVPVRDHEALPRMVELLWGEVPEQVEIGEAGIRYLAAPWHGQKTGAFLDQRENRVRAGELSRGRALDCFSYHGSFALHLAGRADSVVAVDTSADALERARQNARLNGFGHVATVAANAFEFLRSEAAAGQRYDLIVLDPPAFAKRRAALAQALRGYKEINLRALQLLNAGGHLCTFSCSYHVDRQRFRTMLAAAAVDAGRPVRWVEDRGQSADHPELLQVPETSYLKGAILQAM